MEIIIQHTEAFLRRIYRVVVNFANIIVLKYNNFSKLEGWGITNNDIV